MMPESTGAERNLPSIEGAPLHYMVQLDAVRALAVLAVLLSHFGLSGLGARFEIGVWGVRLFFVLSGFLITGILLAERDETATWRERKRILRRFYLRRALRILPLFYFLLVAAALLDIPKVREMFWWHFFYAGNFYLSWQGSWQGPSSHLWSLAVEEQFYFVWPWLILLLSRRFLLPLILFAIASSLFFKASGRALNWNEMTLLTNPLSCLDTLGIGALLAWLRWDAPCRFERLARHPAYTKVGWGLAIIVLASIPLPLFIVTDWAQPLLFGWLVHRAAVGFAGSARKLFEAPPLLACGKISYGLYIFHNFMPYAVMWALAASGFRSSLGIAMEALLFFAATLVCALLSWRFLEQPFLRLKSRFAYA